MSMLAIYRNRIHRVGANLSTCELVDGPTVDFGDVDLTIDPTDRQLADADNLGEFYGVRNRALAALIRTLTTP